MYDKIHYKLKKKVGARKTPLSFRVENLHNNVNYLCLSDKDTLEKGMAVHSVFLPWKSHGPRSLVGYSPWSCKELDMTERLILFPHTFTFILNDRYWFMLWIYSQKIKSTLKMVIFSPQDLRVFSSQYCF